MKIRQLKVEDRKEGLAVAETKVSAAGKEAKHCQQKFKDTKEG